MRRARYAEKRAQAAKDAYDHAIATLGIRAVNPDASGGHGMPGSPTESQAIEISEILARLEAAQAYWGKVLSDVAGAIEALKDPKECICLSSYYLAGRTWEQTAETLEVDLRTVYRIHGRALQHITVPEEYK